MGAFGTPPRELVRGSWPLPTLVLLLLSSGCIEYAVGDEDEQYVESIWVTERFVQAPAARVDLLWVVDDTASMAEEQAALADGFDEFVAALESSDLSYHVGVVTTDASGDRAGQLRGAPWIVTRESADPVADFAQAVAVGTSGTADEAGLAAVVAALTEPVVSDQNRGFRRPDAVLHVVVVSDADDHSEALLADPASEVETLLADAAATSGLPAMLSAVVGDEAVGCSGADGDAAPGDTYLSVARATGGSEASICDGALESILQKLAELTLAAPDHVQLQALPYQDEVRVLLDGERLDTGFTLDGLQLTFDAAPAIGVAIEVTYALAPSEEA